MPASPATQVAQTRRLAKPGAAMPRHAPYPTRLSLPAMQLQRATSSCACDGACPRCQAKSNLTIGAPNDAHEQEADRVADAVVSGGQGPAIQAISPGLQPKLYRKVLKPDEMFDSAGAPDSAQAAAFTEDEDPESASIQRKEAADHTGGETVVSADYEQSLQSAIQGGGSVLPPSTRTFMESRFGQDFSGVRVHDGTQADTLSQQINARAFTVGRDIFFGRSEYAPSSPEGQRLLAHELTHVVQQSSGRLSRQIMRTPCSSYPGYNASIDRLTYNCSGLALRTYTWISPPSAVNAAMWTNFISPMCPVGNCGPGQVKFWLWQYDLHLEDDLGTVLTNTSRDFHIVGGRTDAAGNDPSNVYSKNGRRPIHGPGTGPSFQPASRDPALDDNDNPGTTAAGRPIYKVRSNMSEEITCAGCR
ncbi:DUF4157 domain-containing protein [Aquabacterium sp.]|uniref:eCIS core domain-containing protein n=1 Tax=Aquabacterium sp. TaxID=1872578 RepID=UPI0019C91684|nr:DUF4157 domain-containing protein [Aquabacterium sp.]MBC7701442.1 DUF4157 domain-containing protein [Aquabacterium sp.]